MDNRIFNVNGKGKDALIQTLKLAFEQKYSKTKATAFFMDPAKGMILLWHTVNGATPFPSPLDAEQAAMVVSAWLDSKPDITCEGWDRDHQHDGHNSLGWRVYCEDWGHVTIGPRHSSHEASHYAIVAIKPAYLWHGK